MRSLIVVVFVLGLLPGCKSLRELEANVCGNAVVERGEDCDMFAPTAQSRCVAPGEPNECRLACGGTPAASCPEGWRCGADGLCRTPTGRFLQVETLAAGAVTVQLGDFDGDGRLDALGLGHPDAAGRARGRLFYFGPGVRLDAQRELPTPLIAPVVTAVDADGAADLVSGVVVGVPGMVAWPGRKDRELFPVAPPSYSTGTREVYLAPVSREDGTTRMLELGVFPGQPGLVLRDSARPGEVLAELGAEADFASALAPVVARLRPSGWESVLVPVAKRKAVDVLHLDGDEGLVVSRVQVRFPGPEVEEEVLSAEDGGGLRVADLDGDGHPDLLLASQFLSLPIVRVAWGRADGHFSSAPGQPADDTFAPDPWRLPTDRSAWTDELPLAVGHLSNDAAWGGTPVVDFVFSDHLLLSGPPESGGYFWYTPPVPPQWAAAAIGDFNGNGLPDVVAVPKEGYGLDFLNGTGGVSLVPFSVPTDVRPLHLQVGDFDGDLLEDALFVSTTRSGRSGLHVAFGQALRPPLPPVQVGELDPVRQLARLGSARLLPELAAVTLGAAPQARVEVSRVFCSPDRQPMAPATLAGPEGLSRPVALAAGRFGPGSERALVIGAGPVELAVGGRPWSFWLQSLEGGLGAPQRFSVEPDLRDAFGMGTELRDVAAVDLDGDGRDELAVRTEGWELDEGEGRLANRARVHLGRLGADRAWEPLAQLAVELVEHESVLQERWADLDGDGAPDLVLGVWQGRGEEWVPERVRVLWGDRATGLSGAGLDLPIPMSAWAVQPGDPPTLSYLAGSELAQLQFSGRQPTQGRVVLSDVVAGTSLAAADLDSDGLVDLVLVDDGSLRVLRAEAQNP